MEAIAPYIPLDSLGKGMARNSRTIRSIKIHCIYWLDLFFQVADYVEVGISTAF